MDSFRMAPTIRTVDLVRSWLGQALRATGAAVVVPVAILVALSLTAIGGSGLGGLGAFSQIVSGPRAAGSDVTIDDSDTEIGAAVTQLAASGTGALTAPTTGSGGPVTISPGGGQAPGGQLPGGGNGPGGGDGPGGGIQPTPPSQPPPTSPPPGEPPPPEPPGVVDNVGQTVTDVTAGTPLGPTVEDAVDGLVEVCGRLGCP
jgi:hypothetical protein